MIPTLRAVVTQLHQVLLLSWAELPLGELWRQFRAWVAVPLLRLAVFACLIMSTMVLVEKVSMGLITLYAKVFRRRPARIYKCDPLTEDEEMGPLAYPMVLVQIPMYNEKEVLRRVTLLVRFLHHCSCMQRHHRSCAMACRCISCR
ncbi:hypothetical protein BHE74_00032767 [Ensete ventricosum]|uniref:Uncharacterized protein n=1 Tax=Ensete ventricosum TaxID=4639 RepID=A0A444C514_ENSVE|nr:hypothetical protein B296_00014912 [Ensete ventricosum]RWV81030.1 hypothetical protein GW17_00057591 [Ensete ventricosum]RWW60252.1 hypothetical protein BHE74_00032767 [Ensete ventricosum]